MAKKPKSWRELTPKQKRTRIFDVVFITFLISITFGINPILQSALNTEYPVVVVISDSMVPTIYTGDLLFIQAKSPEDIKAGSHENRTGDVILYDSKGVWDDPRPEPIVHRVVGKYYDNITKKYYFITQGDNLNTNPRTDPPGTDKEIPVPEDKVLGVVVGRIPKLGSVKIWLNDIQEKHQISPYLIVGGIFLTVVLSISLIQYLIHPQKDDESLNKSEKSGTNENPGDTGDIEDTGDTEG
jgi:signal peptidase